jgi:uncharacterized protein YyaL (SSP411 family)
MDEWLSDREHGGFYASQDADYSMDDDGDYFTWTVEETRSVLSEEEAQVACLYYDINEIGEMHHNPDKNVLHVRVPIEEIASRLGKPVEEIARLLDAARKKMYAARLKRPTPFIDKTVYTGWNALCVSAYLEAARGAKLGHARRFALRSLDRILADGWRKDGFLLHVLAYSDPKAERREVPGVLDDYAFSIIACLDAYESSADLSYFHFAQNLADAMIERFFDGASGGFFDTAAKPDQPALGVLGTRRKPFQDSPTPAGNPAAAIALLRLHAYTGEERYRDCATQTLELIAGLAGQYGLFAATYGIAGVHLLHPHTQVVVIGDDDVAQQLFDVAARPFWLTKSILKVARANAVPQALPPVMAQTVPPLSENHPGKSIALLCSGYACQTPVSDPAELDKSVRSTIQGV